MFALIYWQQCYCFLKLSLVTRRRVCIVIKLGKWPSSIKLNPNSNQLNQFSWELFLSRLCSSIFSISPRIQSVYCEHCSAIFQNLLLQRRCVFFKLEEFGPSLNQKWNEVRIGSQSSEPPWLSPSTTNLLFWRQRAEGRWTPIVGGSTALGSSL